MCPACIPSAAMALIGLTTSGGITAVVLPGLFRKKQNDINLENAAKHKATEKKNTESKNGILRR